MSKENFLPLQLDHPQSLPILEIHRSFKEEPAGFRLKYQQVRWSRHKPSHITMYDWQSPRLLGRDANNLEHCYLTYQNALNFIDTQNKSDASIKFTPEEQSLLLLMAETHDWGEGVTKKGDINAEFKTSQDEQDELSVLKPTIVSVLGNTPEINQLAEKIIFYLSSEAKKTKIGQAFHAIEELGYLQTSLRCWQKAPQFSQTDPILSIKLQIIANSVAMGGHIDSLAQVSQDYPYVKTFLKNNKYLINQVFDMDKDIFNHYDLPERIETYKTKFYQAKSNWRRWSKSNL